MDAMRGVVTRVQQKAHETWRIYQHQLDKINPHRTYRWICTLVVALAFCLRVYYVHGFYLIAYLLAVYILILLVGLLSPLVDPQFAGPSLPTRASDEFKPFIRRLPEFKFWGSSALRFVITFFSVFNLDMDWARVFVALFAFFGLTIRDLISPMIKYKYIPFSFGKKKYGERSRSG